MGDGSWDNETVTRALPAAYNNAERAVDYSYSRVTLSTEAAVWFGEPAVGSAATAPASGAPNSSPLNLFPQETAGPGSGLGSLDFLRNRQQVKRSGLGSGLIAHASGAW
ncbi:hypothetical protein ABFS83_09G074700 [Erythranthe nasuta]